MAFSECPQWRWALWHLMHSSHDQARRAIASGGLWADEGPEPGSVVTLYSRPAGLVRAGPPGALEAAKEVVRAFHAALHADDGGAAFQVTLMPAVRAALSLPVPLPAPPKIELSDTDRTPERMRAVLRLPPEVRRYEVEVDIQDTAHLADHLFYSAVSGLQKSHSIKAIFRQLGTGFGITWAFTVMLALYRLNIAIGCVPRCEACRKADTLCQAHNWNTGVCSVHEDLRDMLSIMKGATVDTWLHAEDFADLLQKHRARTARHHLSEFLCRPGSVWNQVWARNRRFGTEVEDGPEEKRQRCSQEETPYDTLKPRL